VLLLEDIDCAVLSILWGPDSSSSPLSSKLLRLSMTFSASWLSFGLPRIRVSEKQEEEREKKRNVRDEP